MGVIMVFVFMFTEISYLVVDLFDDLMQLHCNDICETKFLCSTYVPWSEGGAKEAIPKYIAFDHLVGLINQFQEKFSSVGTIVFGNFEFKQWYRHTDQFFSLISFQAWDFMKYAHDTDLSADKLRLTVANVLTVANDYTSFYIFI